MSDSHPFSLTRAGPFYDLMRRSRLLDAHGNIRWTVLAAILWVPLIIASLIRKASGDSADPIMLDPTVHVRLLVAVPLLLAAERVLEVRCGGAVSLAQDEHIAPAPRFDAILRRAERLRASRLAEVVLAFIALVGGQAALWGLVPASGLVSGIDRSGTVSFATFWYTTLALPVVQFLVMRWLWRWLIWTYVLAHLSRLPLATNGLHPDNAAGLKILNEPIDAFAVFVAASVVVASAGWTVQINQQHVAIQTFVPRLLAFVVLALVLSCGPLVCFFGQIYRARYRDVERYHRLAYDYVDRFRRKWTRGDPENADDLLGTPDIQSLNDLDGAFEVADKTRVIPFGARPIVRVLVGALLPILPLVIATTSLKDAAHLLGKMMQLPLL